MQGEPGRDNSEFEFELECGNVGIRQFLANLKSDRLEFALTVSCIKLSFTIHCCLLFATQK